MAKGDDVRRRKQNKEKRKKLNKNSDSSSAVSSRVAALIAAKKRRKSGKRRRCEGMCFSLPTPEDPYNDKQGKKDVTTNKAKKTKVSREPVKTNGHVQKERPLHDKKSMDELISKEAKMVKSGNDQHFMVPCDKIKSVKIAKTGKETQTPKNPVAPSKFLLLCLKSIRDSLLGDSEVGAEQENTIVADKWGVQFWKSYLAGKDVLDTSGTNPTVQQIAWVTSVAADAISSKDEQDGSFMNPALIYLVPSQKDATKVRSVCKPLKAFGIHTVSLHPGATVDHQIHGLKSCEPEFIVATPERLLELVSLEAIDLSGVSLLVVDGLAEICETGSLNVLTHVRQSLSKNSRTVVFQGPSGGFSIESVRSILQEPIARTSLSNASKN
ncbi:putative ATP-dependent RNA helicase ddx5 [Drosera capensis]